MNKVLVILGPTATGKTDLALLLAKKFNGELVACDSRQVYKGLDIGTGKYPTSVIPARFAKRAKAGIQLNTKSHGSRIKYGMTITKGNGFWEINNIKIWLYDLIDLNKQYTVADYIKDASKIINKIHSNNKLPIIVGGTGFYLKALLEGIDNISIPINLELREELSKLNKDQLQEQLQKQFPNKWEKLNSSDKQNPRRLLRSIEISMNPYIGRVKNSELSVQNWDLLKIGLTAPREVLYKKVDLRILDWFKDGIIYEVKKLNETEIPLERFEQLGLAYGLIAKYIKRQIKTKEELTERMRSSLHGYVKRQQTWFKKENDISWFSVTDKNFLQKIEKQTMEWYD